MMKKRNNRQPFFRIGDVEQLPFHVYLTRLSRLLSCLIPQFLELPVMVRFWCIAGQRGGGSEDDWP